MATNRFPDNPTTGDTYTVEQNDGDGNVIASAAYVFDGYKWVAGMIPDDNPKE